MVEKKKAAGRGPSRGAPRKALLFELENVAVNGHQIAFDVLEDVLRSKDIDLPLSLFGRYCLCHSPRGFASRILKSANKPRLSEQKLIQEITEKQAAAFTAASLKPQPALKRLMKDAADRGLLLGALSSLDKATAEALAANLGLTAMKLNLMQVSCENRCFAGADGWLRLARTMSVAPIYCATLATSAPSARAALAARMHCIALPDHYTAFQDFGGCDYVVNALDDLPSADLFAILEPAW